MRIIRRNDCRVSITYLAETPTPICETTEQDTTMLTARATITVRFPEGFNANLPYKTVYHYEPF